MHTEITINITLIFENWNHRRNAFYFLYFLFFVNISNTNKYEKGQI